MKKLYPAIFVLIILLSATTYGQTSFLFSPSNTLDSIHQLNQYGSHQIDILKKTTEDLTLGWATVYKDWPHDWETTLCPYGACLTGIPDSGEMITLYSGENAYMRITMNPFDFVDTGFVEFNIWDINNVSDSAHCTFRVTSDDFTTIIEKDGVKQITVYPNPASEYVILKNEIDSDDVVLIYSTAGALVYSGPIAAKKEKKVFINHFEPGVYFVTYGNLRAVSRKLIVR